MALLKLTEASPAHSGIPDDVRTAPTEVCATGIGVRIFFDCSCDIAKREPASSRRLCAEPIFGTSPIVAAPVSLPMSDSRHATFQYRMLSHQDIAIVQRANQALTTVWPTCSWKFVKGW